MWLLRRQSPSSSKHLQCGVRLHYPADVRTDPQWGATADPGERWLSTVPVMAFLLLTRWRRFRRSTSRVLPTPHLRWRGEEFLEDLNALLASYTRAESLSALIVGTICWVGFAALGLPYPGTLGLAAGLLEMVPLAGPIVAAVVATSMAPDRALPVLGFLAGLRVVQDYVVYPRLISRRLRLHPLAVVAALWVGAGLGGVVGVCLAVPLVGMLQVIHRLWREYHEIGTMVERERGERQP
jgi:predicted PurR-regulated permease PerM